MTPSSLRAARCRNEFREPGESLTRRCERELGHSGVCGRENDSPPGWSARDIEILAENVAMVRKFGLNHAERGDDPVEVFERMLDHIAGFVAGTQAMVVPPHMIDPAELEEAVALGRKLAEQYDW